MADELSYDADELLRAVCKIFEALNVPADDALCVADCLIWANLRGIDSHGVIRIPSYVHRVDEGIVNPKPKMEVVKDTLAGMIIDAGHGFGPIALTFAMDKAIEKARHASIGWVLVKNSSHAGAVGYYTRRAAKVGMAGLFMGASQPNMAYHGARVAGVATNPIAISVPGRKHEVIALDMATAVAGVGKLMMHRDTGQTLGPGWALDANGDPTTDPQRAKIPTPLGGPKGSGLSLMFECLTSLMVGAPLVERMINGTYTTHQQNGLVVAIDIAAFTDPDRYRADVDKLAAAIKGLPAAAGVDEILLPGERGDAVLRQRTRAGIPVPANTWQRIENVAADLGVKLPSPLLLQP